MSHPRRSDDKRQFNRRSQQGAAFIVMLVIMALGVATVLVSSLSSGGLKIARDVKTSEALAQAKEALIGEAAIHDTYPASLPCPDTDDDGISDAGGGTDCPQYIGRLPWKTLGLPDLHDATGERLWYTLSRNVRRYNSVRPLNSDIVGTLDITGTHPENDLIAIVFAPGAAVSPQKRSSTQTASCSTTGTTILESRCAANYLEGINDDPSPGASPNTNYQNENSAIQFNDQLATISHDQLFATVEKRIAKEIKNVLNTYYAAWGRYPYAAPFADPSTSTFTGQASPATLSGLLPVGDNLKPTWAGAPSISFSGSGSSDPCYLDDSGGVNDVRWICDNVLIANGETITITGTLNNVGRGLWRPHYIGNICEVRAKNSSGTTMLVTNVLNSVTITNTLNTNSSATITFQAQGKSGYDSLDRIELRSILDYTTDIRNNSNTSDCAPTPTSPLIPEWLFDHATKGNNWHQVAYYSVAEEFAPGGDLTCTSSPCLTVNGQGGTSGNRALVTMTGRSIAGAHPSATLSDYLEGENLTPADFIFENIIRSATFNDQVIFIAP